MKRRGTVVRMRWSIVAVALLAGCSADSTTSTPRNGALVIQQHGAVEVRFQRSTADLENPFEGTTQAVLSFAYGDCYLDFYADNPDWAFDGGQLDLAEWNDALCNTDAVDASLADCEVVSVQQDLDAEQPTLTVTYEILGPLEQETLLFGPIPVRELATCEGGFSPRVEILATDIHGRDALGTPLWSLLSTSTIELAPGDMVTVNGTATAE